MIGGADFLGDLESFFVESVGFGEFAALANSVAGAHEFGPFVLSRLGTGQGQKEERQSESCSEHGVGSFGSCG